MNPNAQTPQTQSPTKKPSGRASTTAGVLSILGLVLTGFGSLLIHADYRSQEPLTTTAEKVDNAVAGATLHIYSVLIGVPFLVAGIVLASLAIIFGLVRLRRAKSTGLVLNLIWLVLAAWAIQIVIAAFSAIKAHSS